MWSESSEKDFSKRGGEQVGIDYIGGDTYWANYPETDYNSPDSEPLDLRTVRLMIYKTDQSLPEFFTSRYDRGDIEVSGKTEGKIGGKDSLEFAWAAPGDDPQAMVKATVALIRTEDGIMCFSGESDLLGAMVSTLEFRK